MAVVLPRSQLPIELPKVQRTAAAVLLWRLSARVKKKQSITRIGIKSLRTQVLLPISLLAPRLLRYVHHDNPHWGENQKGETGRLGARADGVFILAVSPNVAGRKVYRAHVDGRRCLTARPRPPQPTGCRAEPMCIP